MPRSYGMHLPRRGSLTDGTSIKAVARCAEDAGFVSLWAGEHIVMPADFSSAYPYSKDGSVSWSPTTPYLDPLVSLSVAGAVTERVLLGTSILLLPLRNPVITAKTVATMDYMTGGRVLLGVGAGWLEEEFDIVGEPFPERGPRLTEAIELMRRCWDDGPIDFAGTYFDPPPFFMEPKPVAGSRLPVICGGKTTASMRRVAQVGDGWMPSHISPPELKSRLAQLSEMLATRGRKLEDLIVAPVPGHEVVVDADLADEYFDAGATTLLCDANFSGTLTEALESIEAMAVQLGL